MSAIYCSILCSTECNSATYSIKYKTCITFVERFYDSNILWSEDEEWELLYRDEQRLQYGDWTMVFSARKEINISVYDVWTATGRHDDSPLTSGVLNGCYRLDNLGSCKQHFRSSILDNWSNITQVKFSTYVNGSEVNYIVFDGKSTNRDSWFTQRNILNSSWPFIRTDGNLNRFYLFENAQNNRRIFNIFGWFSACPTDQAYVIVVDKSYDICALDWSLSVTNFPVVIYSKFNTMARVGYKEYSLGDVVAVFVKFK